MIVGSRPTGLTWGGTFGSGNSRGGSDYCCTPLCGCARKRGRKGGCRCRREVGLGMGERQADICGRQGGGGRSREGPRRCRLSENGGGSPFEASEIRSGRAL